MGPAEALAQPVTASFRGLVLQGVAVPGRVVEWVRSRSCTLRVRRVAVFGSVSTNST